MRVCRCSFIVAFVVGSVLASHARADETISLKTLDEIKNATVFIISRQEGGGGGVGSGFAISVEGDAVYIATNNHVIRPHPQNNGGPQVIQIPTVTATFRSSTRNEQTVQATIMAADEQRDLAILRVAGVRNPPKAIDFQNTPPLVETTTVYIFGFPYGHKLASPGGRTDFSVNPGVSINKGTISALRNDIRGELAWVQINGDLNPGNSGGPIVNADGQLVGISTMVKLDERTGQMTRIGFAVPFDAVSKLIKRSRLPAPSEVPASVTVSTQGSKSLKGEKHVISLEELNQVVTDLRSTDDAVRYRAAKTLANTKVIDEARVGVSLLLEQLLKEENPAARKSGAEALGVWASPRQIPLLIKLIQDPETKVRGQAMRSLAALAEAKAAEAIAVRLTVESDRKYASKALCELGAAAEKAVHVYLAHEEAVVRAEACRILKIIGTEGSRAPLKKAASDGDQVVATAATEALLAIKSRR
jgi:S1-C subfamily serine protease